LSNPTLAKYLIVAVGAECYLTFPKGQLVPTQGAESREGVEISKVPGGGHVLIVPIAHFMTLGTIPGELRVSILGECGKYVPFRRAVYMR
jgi:Protein similar to CwfJ C-terminus 1